MGALLDALMPLAKGIATQRFIEEDEYLTFLQRFHPERPMLNNVRLESISPMLASMFEEFSCNAKQRRAMQSKATQRGAKQNTKQRNA